MMFKIVSFPKVCNDKYVLAFFKAMIEVCIDSMMGSMNVCCFIPISLWIKVSPK